METVACIMLIIAGIGFFIFPWCYGEDWDWIFIVGPWVMITIMGILALLDRIFGIF